MTDFQFLHPAGWKPAKGYSNGVAADPACAKRLQDHVKATIAPYKYPRAVNFVDALPKTATGKIQRFRLRQQ